jgi:AraC family transcriptional regulator, regulatory protein of adaptative response / DNA-3-methyladenine glycosylase II
VAGLGLNQGMTLDPDTCYRAVAARDPRFDGRFFTGVTSTGVYCRPICPSRTPARKNMRFFPHQGAAETAGFRACRRCRPEASPGSPDWNTRADLVARAVRLISDGYVDEHGIGGLARRLAVTERHLHRLVVAELGTGPLALARTVRLQTARRLLSETSVPITEIAFASGFSSVRQFNASFQESYRQPPSALRARPRPRGAAADGTGRGTWLSLRLACREPSGGESLLGFLAARAIPGVEQVADGRYTRTIRTSAGAGVIELTPGPSGSRQVLLRVRLTGLGGVGQVVSRCRQLFDLDADPAAISSVLASDDILAPLVRKRPGLRIPGAYDGFELAVRAVLGQQVSVAAARTFAARLAAQHGTPLGAPDELSAAGAHAVAAGTRAVAPDRGTSPAMPGMLFPGPDQLAGADLSGLGLTTSRQATLRALAIAVATGRLDLDAGTDPAEAAARLSELPGVGPWTVSYILMRAIRDPDAFPETDLGLRRAMERLGCPPAQARRWRPWRAYAAVHLWTWAAGTPVTAALTPVLQTDGSQPEGSYAS